MAEQKQTKYQSLYLINEDVKPLFDTLDKKKCKIISSESEFEKFIGTNFQLKEVCIQVELDWSEKKEQFYGYEIAKYLINSSNRNASFNLYFISSYKRQELLDLNKNKNRIFTQKFFHSEINTDLSNIKAPQLSERKFDYLKNYCLLESGILDRLEHDVRRALENLNDQKLKKLIEDIKVNEDILTNDIVKKAEKLISNNSVQIKNKLTEIHRQLQVLQSQINNPGETAGKKSYSVVMLIEDEPSTLEKLERQFGQYFHTIKSYHKGTDAYNELENNSQKYDVVITDMELLVGNFDDEKLGIDILELCEREYPFIVTRVITSLPKNALKRLIGKGLDEIIFKSVNSESVIPPFENLVEFVQHIDKEVRQRKMLRSMPGPKGSWWGKFLTKELYLKKLQQPEEFTSIWSNAKNKATSFLQGHLDHAPNQDKVSASLKQVNDTSNNPQAGWEIIELLLTHRLIAIGFAAKHNWDEFHYSGDSQDAYVNQPGFQEGMVSKPSKTYFNTFLGLSAPGGSDKRGERSKCRINPKDFFPEEIEWLTEHQPDIVRQLSLTDIDESFHESLSEFAAVYNDSSLSKDATVADAILLLEKFAEEYPEEKSDEKKYNELKYVFNWKLFDLIESLPPEIQSVLKKMKEEIFYS
jgi:hypothetical protein